MALPLLSPALVAERIFRSQLGLHIIMHSEAATHTWTTDDANMGVKSYDYSDGTNICNLIVL